MIAGITRVTTVKIGMVVFILVVILFGLLRFNNYLREVSMDEAVRNQLRNLYAAAREYSAQHGKIATVQVSELDQTALYTAGIRPPLNGVFPATVILGAPLTVTGVDGERTVIYQPGH